MSHSLHRTWRPKTLSGLLIQCKDVIFLLCFSSSGSSAFKSFMGSSGSGSKQHEPILNGIFFNQYCRLDWKTKNLFLIQCKYVQIFLFCFSSSVSSAFKSFMGSSGSGSKQHEPTLNGTWGELNKVIGGLDQFTPDTLQSWFILLGAWSRRTHEQYECWGSRDVTTKVGTYF